MFNIIEEGVWGGTMVKEEKLGFDQNLISTTS